MLQGTPSPKACLNNLVRKKKKNCPSITKGTAWGRQKKSHTASPVQEHSHFPHPGCGSLSHHPSCTGHPLCSLPIKKTSRALRVLASQGHVPTAHGRLWGAQPTGAGGALCQVSLGSAVMMETPRALLPPSRPSPRNKGFVDMNTDPGLSNHPEPTA